MSPGAVLGGTRSADQGDTIIAPVDAVLGGSLEVTRRGALESKPNALLEEALGVSPGVVLDETLGEDQGETLG